MNLRPCTNGAGSRRPTAPARDCHPEARVTAPADGTSYRKCSQPRASDSYRNPFEFRTKIFRLVQFLQDLTTVDIGYFQLIQQNLNQASATEGQHIASAATITPTAFIMVVTGTATITNIHVPLGFSGQLMLISQNGFSLATGGNISLGTSPVTVPAGTYILLTWVPSTQLWYGPR